MGQAEIFQTGIDGLDLVLGGGVRMLRRVEGAESSAALLLRGPPGSGKTLLGVQIAAALAHRLGGDVVCGCIELLPLELDAQLGGFRLPGLLLPVLAPPFAPPEDEAHARIYAGLLDLGGAAEEPENLEGAIVALLEAVRGAGGRPRALVLDSLSDGYRLGASAPRELADGICKLAAAQGLLLILLEEATDRRPSGWSFACDTVVELGVFEEERSLESPDTADRPLRIPKHRLGPSDAGPHRFTLDEEGARVFPRPAAYAHRWAEVLALPPLRKEYPLVQSWSGLHHFTLRRCIIAVKGSSTARVIELADQLGLSGVSGESPGTDVLISFGALPPTRRRASMTLEIVHVSHPFISAHELLGRSLMAVRFAEKENEHGIRRVLIGDLHTVNAFRSPVEIRQALTVLASMLRRRGIPSIFFETTPIVQQNDGTIIEADATGSQFADVEIRSNPYDGQSWSAVDLRTGMILRS